MGGSDGEAGKAIDDLILSNEEREKLQRWACRPKSAQALALRCRIVDFGIAENRQRPDDACRLEASASAEP